MTFALFTATRVVPDLIADPGNQFGHARTSEYFGTLALVMIFSYPVGLGPALVSSVTQFCIRNQVLAHRPRCVLLVSLAGVVAMGVEQSFYFNESSLSPLVAAAVSAALVSLYVSRTHSAMQSGT